VNSKERLQRKNGRILQEIRKASGLSTQALGEMAELSHQMIAFFECGQRFVSLEAWGRILSALSWWVTEGPGNLKWSFTKRELGRERAKALLAQLGVNIAHTPSRTIIEEMEDHYKNLMENFVLNPKDVTLEQIPEILELSRNIAELGMRIGEDYRTKACQEKQWRGALERVVNGKAAKELADYKELFAKRSEALGKQAEADDLQQQIVERAKREEGQE